MNCKKATAAKIIIRTKYETIFFSLSRNEILKYECAPKFTEVKSMRGGMVTSCSFVYCTHNQIIRSFSLTFAVRLVSPLSLSPAHSTHTHKLCVSRPAESIRLKFYCI